MVLKHIEIHVTRDLISHHLLNYFAKICNLKKMNNHALWTKSSIPCCWSYCPEWIIMHFGLNVPFLAVEVTVQEFTGLWPLFAPVVLLSTEQRFIVISHSLPWTCFCGIQCSSIICGIIDYLNFYCCTLFTSMHSLIS